MNNNLMNPNGSLLSKIFYSFKRFFSKNKTSYNTIENNEKQNSTVLDCSNFTKNLKDYIVVEKNIYDNMDINTLIQEIEKSPEILERFDIERLEKIDNYYTEIIDSYKKKLNIA